MDRRFDDFIDWLDMDKVASNATSLAAAEDVDEDDPLIAAYYSLEVLRQYHDWIGTTS